MEARDSLKLTHRPKPAFWLALALLASSPIASFSPARAQEGDTGNGSSIAQVFDAVLDLTACQVGYGDPGQVRLAWSNPESFESVAITLDGVAVDAGVDGASGRVEVDVSPGTHELSVQGEVGDWSSVPATVTFDVLAESPLKDPVAEVSCEFIPGSGGTLRIEWTAGSDRWELGEARRGGRDGTVEFGPADSPLDIPLLGARPDSLVVAFRSSECYFSDPLDLPCAQLVPAFRRGDCDGSGRLDITDAIFTADHLFQGHPRWRCDDACDSNDDGVIDLNDPIEVLEFLFRSGAPPAAPGPSTCGIDPTDDFLGGICEGLCP